MEVQMLRDTIRQSVREVLREEREERLSLFLALIPIVSDKDIHKIEAKFPTPSKYAPEEFTDMTDWIKS
ncbi:hypothetical protein [Synechococcus sp. PCC 7502]|uniref:hypothetical protein n=1 Tax=Synechococcus sp. PCC 7502 TaxID=1173263 RepID=UPI00059BC416|nr:hypothetical protein [Synechococcus sp. PCC 7502]